MTAAAVELHLDDQRQAILTASGHLLIEGGPGCGKTTIALLKARVTIPALESDQRILFLSFSRAAVRQVLDRTQGVLTRGDRDRIEVRTFHAFFLDLVRSHGRLLTGNPARFITPEREAQRQADHEGDWATEIGRLAREESLFVFDTLAPTAANLLERSRSLRLLYSDIYPLIIVDEFQDTDRDQWRVVKALAEASTIVCLADPDQRIFDYMDTVDAHRLLEAELFLQPQKFDLSTDNHRSPGSGILDYANAVLNNRPTSPPTEVRSGVYGWQEAMEAKTHQAVLWVRHLLSEQLGRTPTIAVLTRTNALAVRISETLGQEQAGSNGASLAAVDHVLHWEPELSAAAGLVVASLLEWPAMIRHEAVAHTLIHIADFYRLKLGRGTAGARGTINKLDRAVTAVGEGRTPTAKAAKVLLAIFDSSTELTGQPVHDWRITRNRLAGSVELDEIFKQARLLRLLHATDTLAWALLDAWDGATSYRNAADVVRVALADEVVNAARVELPLVSVMTIHKAKGKEFDAVLIAEGRHQGTLLSEDPNDQDADRRVLRVAITRARHFVGFVRPHDAPSLTPVGPQTP